MDDEYIVDNWSFSSKPESVINIQDKCFLKCYSNDKDETYVFNATLIRVEKGDTT